MNISERDMLYLESGSPAERAYFLYRWLGGDADDHVVLHTRRDLWQKLLLWLPMRLVLSARLFSPVTWAYWIAIVFSPNPAALVLFVAWWCHVFICTMYQMKTYGESDK